jgi:aryl-alcohol dehydrogenase-like predicted oxidoreductase
VKQGKVRAIGASNYTAPRLSEALDVSKKHGLPRYESLQPLYNLYDRADYEATLEPVCRKNEIGVIPYYSLASGFLTGKYRGEGDLAKSARGAGVKKYLNQRGFRTLEALDQTAKKYNSTPAKVALAWLLTRPTITAPIASATNVAQLLELLDATNLNLDRESTELLDQASAPSMSVSN